jgi:hypothetical protein
VVSPGISKEDVKMLNQDIRSSGTTGYGCLKAPHLVIPYFTCTCPGTGNFLVILWLREDYRQQADVTGARLRKPTPARKVETQ